MEDTSSSAVKLLSRHPHPLLLPPTKSARHYLLHRNARRCNLPPRLITAGLHGWIAHNKAAAKLTCRDGILATYPTAAAIGRFYSKQ